MAQFAMIYFMDDASPVGQAAGTLRGWKVAFGYSNKGTIVCVYTSDGQDGVITSVSEIAKLANGKVDVNAVTAFLASSNVVLTQAVKNVIGA